MSIYLKDKDLKKLVGSTKTSIKKYDDNNKSYFKIDSSELKQFLVGGVTFDKR